MLVNLGFNPSGSFTRVEFMATAKKDYFLVIGRRDTLMAEGQSFSVFGRFSNGRWRCCMDRGGGQDNEKVDAHLYPLIGSVPTSIIKELNQPSRIKDLVDSLSISSNEISPPGTPADDLSTTSASSFTYNAIPGSQSPCRTLDAPAPCGKDSISEPYSNHKSDSIFTSTTCVQSAAPTRPTQLNPSSNPVFIKRVTLPSASSISPTSPRPESITNAIMDLNRALESLAALKPRPRVSSTSSRTSNSSQEEESSDMSCGAMIGLNSDDEFIGRSKSGGLWRFICGVPGKQGCVYVHP